MFFYDIPTIPYIYSSKTDHMAKTDYKSIDDYHQAFDGDILKRMQTIRELVQKIAPEAQEVISYQIPAFKIGKDALIYYSAYAKHISLSHPWSKALLEAFEEDLKGRTVTKSAIHLPNDQELPVDFIRRLVEFRKKEISGK